LNIVVNDYVYEPGIPRGAVLDQIPREGMIVKPGRKIYVTINSLDQRMVEVPYVVGLSLRDAKSKLEIAGFTIESLQYVQDIATDRVIAEFVNDEKVSHKVPFKAREGSGVVLKVGVAPSEREVVVPNVVGLSLYDAKSKIWSTGLNVGKITFDDCTTRQEQKETKVYSQSIEPGTVVGRGTYVKLSLTSSLDIR
jgi:beta-lactam-binding protein with PASTA domain